MKRRSATTARAVAQLPDFIDVVTVGVRAGLSLHVAVASAAQQVPAPLREFTDPVAHRLARGDRLADALDGLAEALGHEVATFTDTLATTDRYGLPIEPVLERLASDSRAARRRLADRYARTLPVRLSFPLVMCTLPSFVMCAIVPALLGTLSDLRDLTP